MLSKVFLVLASVVFAQANIQQYEDFSQINQIQDYSAYENPQIQTFYSQIPSQILTRTSYPNNAIYSEQIPQYYSPQYIAKDSLEGLIINQTPQVYSQIINAAEFPIQSNFQPSPIYRENIQTPIITKSAPVYTTSLIQSVPEYVTAYRAPVQVKTVKAPLVASYVSPTFVPQIEKQAEYPIIQQNFNPIQTKNVPSKPSLQYLPSSNQAPKSNNGQYSSAPSVSRSSFSSPSASYSY